MSRQRVPQHHWAYVAVDVVVLTIRDDRLHVMTVRRGVEPRVGDLALPGGFIDLGEDLEPAAHRELREETGLVVDHLEQVRTYGRPDRDPRERTIAVVHLAIVPDLPDGEAGTDAADAQWVPVDDLLAADLPLDHHEMLTDAVERARARLEYSPIATRFCGPTFTIAELRRVYEIVWGTRLDPANFHRKVRSVDGFVEATGERISEGRGRPAELFRAGAATAMHPPLAR